MGLSLKGDKMLLELTSEKLFPTCERAMSICVPIIWFISSEYPVSIYKYIIADRLYKKTDLQPIKLYINCKI
jgi:hypothetical protein